MHHPGISIRLAVKDQPGLRPGGWIRKPRAQNLGAYIIRLKVMLTARGELTHNFGLDFGQCLATGAIFTHLIS